MSGLLLQRWQEHEEEEEQDYVAATLGRVHRLAPVAAPAGMRTRPGLHKPASHPGVLSQQSAASIQEAGAGSCYHWRAL